MQISYCFYRDNVSIIDAVSCHDVAREDRIRQRWQKENKFHIMAPFTGALFTPAGSSKVNSQVRGVWNPADFRPLTYTVRQNHCPRPGIFLHHSQHVLYILLSTVATDVDLVQKTDHNLLRAVSQWQDYFKEKTKRLELSEAHREDVATKNKLEAQTEAFVLYNQDLKLYGGAHSWLQTFVLWWRKRTVGLLWSSFLRQWSGSSFSRGE